MVYIIPAERRIRKMIFELLTKIAFKKISFLALMFISSVNPTNLIEQKDRKLEVSDPVPGDNYPYFLMTSK